MKHTIFIAFIAMVITGFSGCAKNDGISAMIENMKAKNPSIEENFDDDQSYALGMGIGFYIKNNGAYINIEEFVKGILEVIYDEETRFDEEEAKNIENQAFRAAYEKMKAKAREDEEIFLAENTENPEIITTESGLQYEIIEETSGPKPVLEDTVLIHYEGSFVNGEVFGSSHELEEPTNIPLAHIFPGWAEGIQLMSVGSIYRFYIPSSLGAGDDGGGPFPPFSTLVFETELLEILDPSEGN